MGMKKYFLVSLVKNGILGGGIVADSEAITFRTGKVTVPPEYRHITMRYKDILDAEMGWLFILPTVTVTMKSGKEYRFAVFFSRKRFVDTLISMGAEI
jgi:hypothetical protein